MDKIIIGFSRPRAWFSPFSWLICAVDRSPFSHVYFVVHSDEYDRDLVFQASGLYVNFFSHAIFDSREIVHREFVIPISTETKTRVMQFTMDSVGLRYGLAGALGIGWVKLCALFGKRVVNPFDRSGSTYWCSKIAARVMVEFLGDKIDGDPCSMTPTDLYNYLAAHPADAGWTGF